MNRVKIIAPDGMLYLVDSETFVSDADANAAAYKVWKFHPSGPDNTFNVDGLVVKSVMAHQNNLAGSIVLKNPQSNKPEDGAGVYKGKLGVDLGLTNSSEASVVQDQQVAKDAGSAIGLGFGSVAVGLLSAFLLFHVFGKRNWKIKSRTPHEQGLVWASVLAGLSLVNSVAKFVSAAYLLGLGSPKSMNAGVAILLLTPIYFGIGYAVGAVYRRIFPSKAVPESSSDQRYSEPPDQSGSVVHPSVEEIEPSFQAPELLTTPVAQVSPTPQVSAVSSARVDSSAIITDEVDQEAIWSALLAELDGPKRRNGLYAKCFTESDGNEPKTRAAYLRERFHEIQNRQQVVVS